VLASARELDELMTRILHRNGARERDAGIQSTQLLEAELRGHPSHGFRRLPTLVRRLENGFVKTDSQPVFNWSASGVLRVDGDRGFGPVVAWDTLDLLARGAEHAGIAIALVRNNNHIGMLSPYVERIARDGAIGIALTTSEALVHPWGGARALIGTNPLAIGVPGGDEPLVLDMSTGAVAMGRILNHADRGTPIPEGWAVDADGRPTTDAAAAARGAISPFGGAKGFALGLALEAIVGVLTESAFGRNVHGTVDPESEATKGDVFIRIDLERIGETNMLPLLDEYLDEVRASGDVRVPGDRARQSRASLIEEGISLDAALWERVAALDQSTSG
jgi:LDH2 family malate/lactate/ureidoglycolate dehydrogenase